MAEKISKVVHYRKFDPLTKDWSHGTLQSIFKNALLARTEHGDTFSKNWERRCFPVGSDDGMQRFTHSISVSAENIFGLLCLFIPDDWTPILKRAVADADRDTEHMSLDEALQVEIAERRPVDGEDYLRGIAYWLIVADHFFVVQHTSIQTKAFEEYFSSFFRAAKVISNDEKFALRAVFDKTIVGGDLEDISAVEIGGLLERGSSKHSDEIEKKYQSQKVVGRRKGKFAKAINVLKAIFDPPDAERILESIPNEAELEVDVRFGYKSSKRKLSRQALTDIASAARNLPDGEVLAIGKNGKQIGNDLRLSLSIPFSRLRPNGALLDLVDARNQLLKVYQRFVEDGKIDP